MSVDHEGFEISILIGQYCSVENLPLIAIFVINES